MDDIIARTIEGLIVTKNDMIREAFLWYGFDMEYLEQHKDEFEVIIMQYDNRERYYHFGMPLFEFVTEYSEDGTAIKLYINFAIKEDSDEDNQCWIHDSNIYYRRWIKADRKSRQNMLQDRG